MLIIKKKKSNIFLGQNKRKKNHKQNVSRQYLHFDYIFIYVIVNFQLQSDVWQHCCSGSAVYVQPFIWQLN